MRCDPLWRCRSSICPTSMLKVAAWSRCPIDIPGQGSKSVLDALLDRRRQILVRGVSAGKMRWIAALTTCTSCRRATSPCAPSPPRAARDAAPSAARCSAPRSPSSAALLCIFASGSWDISDGGDKPSQEEESPPPPVKCVPTKRRYNHAPNQTCVQFISSTHIACHVEGIGRPRIRPLPTGPHRAVGAAAVPPTNSRSRSAGATSHRKAAS